MNNVPTILSGPFPLKKDTNNRLLVARWIRWQAALTSAYRGEIEHVYEAEPLQKTLR